ncbi:MAG: hypothetical protein ACYC77_11720 [Coriobacteriia bacterium]
MTARGRLWVLALVVALVLSPAVLAGCAGTSDGGDATGGGSTDSGGGEVKLSGEVLVAQRCTYCHNTERIDAASYDQAGWESTIDKMVKKGAQVSDAEKPVIAEYLANR